MSFNMDAVLGNMLSAVKDSVDTDWNDVQGYAKQILENEKEALATLAQQRINGEITEEELQSELDDEKDTVEAEMNAIQVMNKAMAQRAANAAMDVLLQAIKIAI
ncbi:MAG: hypothetical protein R8L53_09610 [Mariprofundales bacterium]